MARRNRYYEEPVVEETVDTPIVEEDVVEIPVADDVPSDINEEVEPVVEEIIPEILVKIRPQVEERDCKVLTYNPYTKKVAFEFEGLGFNIGNVLVDPGETIKIKFEGKVGKPGFRFFQ